MLAVTTPVDRIVREYELACDAVRQMSKLSKLVPFHICARVDGGFDVRFDEPERLVGFLRQSFWRRIYTETGMIRLLSTESRQSFEDSLVAANKYHPADLPEITEESVLSTLELMAKSAPVELDKRIKELWRICSFNYKTNSPKGIRRRLILNNAIDVWQRSSKYWMPYHSQTLQNLEELLWIMMVGAPPAGPAGLRWEAEPTIGCSERKRLQFSFGEWTDVPGPDGKSLWRVKGHKVGSVHVELLCDQDVIDEFNRTATRIFGCQLGW